MAFAFGGAGALLKAFVPAFSGLTARRSIAGANGRPPGRGTAARVPVIVLSPEAEAALAPLGLPPDGPIDPNAAQRARLAPDVAARNFVRWAQALDLDGDYATRSVYALYCEFSEVDGRPPLRDTRFLPALAQTEGVATIARGKDKGCRLWRWTIAPAKPIETVAEAIADVWSHVAAPASGRAAKTAASVPHPDPVPKVTAPVAPKALAAGVPTHSAARASEVTAPGRSAEAIAPAPARAHAAKVAAPASSRAPEATALAASQAADARQPEPALASRRPPEGTAPAVAQAMGMGVRQAKPTSPARASEARTSTSASAPVRPIRSAIIVPRFVADTEHPFSPAGLREREKSARRLRLNAAASRKQRGALRRAA